jgi:hypothetical protein
VIDYDEPKSVSIPPLIERELRVQSRKAALYWGRMSIAALATLLCLLSVSINSLSQAPSSGASLLQSMMTFVFVAAGFGFVLTLDCISSERREGTLALLTMTRVSPLEVVLCKFAAYGLGSLSALGATAPALAIPILLGGTTAGETIRFSLAAVNFLIISLAIGVWASSLQRNAVARGILALLCVCAAILPATSIEGACLFAVLVAVWALATPAKTRGRALLLALSLIVAVIGVLNKAFVFNPLVVCSPFEAYRFAQDMAFRNGPWQFWGCVVAGPIIALLFLMGAARQFGQRDILETQPAPLALGAAPKSRKHLDGDPGAWLVTRQRKLRVAIWMGVLLTLFAYVYLPVSKLVVNSNGLSSIVKIATTLLTSGVSSIIANALFAWAATGFLWEARSSGSMEILAATPLGRAGVIQANWNGLKRLFFWPLIVISIVRLFLFLSSQSAPGSVSASISRPLLWGIMLLWVEMAATCWVGAWMSLRVQSRAMSVISTLAIVIISPNAIQIFFLQLLFAFYRGFFLGNTFFLNFISFASCAIQLACFVGLIWFARRRICHTEPMRWRDFLESVRSDITKMLSRLY